MSEDVHRLWFKLLDDTKCMLSNKVHFIQSVDSNNEFVGQFG